MIETFSSHPTVLFGGLIVTWHHNIMCIWFNRGKSGVKGLAEHGNEESTWSLHSDRNEVIEH